MAGRVSMRVLVIGGGISPEREVSLKSSKNVFDSIDESKHQKEFYDWDGSEDWLAENLTRFDVVLPILHGVGGEDGQIQAILEKYGITKYLGAGVDASKLCIDKPRTQALLRENGILVPAQAVVDYQEYLVNELANNKHVLKPLLGGSSVDTFLLRDGRLEESVAKDVFDRNGKMILETLIEGQEITVPVVEGMESLSIIGIVPPEGQFFDYVNKYNGATKEICDPDFVSDDIKAKANEQARKIFDLTGCRHIARVDFIINSEDNNLYAIEINTIPGLTSESLLPRPVLATGITWEQFVEYLIDLASK